MAKRRILVVDDDPEIVLMLSTRLAHRGYAVTTAADGNAALEQARGADRPEVVLLDVMMPGKSGWEVAKALKHDPATAGIKIVMVTAIGETTNELTSPLYGADAHIDKPFEFDKLERVVAQLLERSSGAS